MNFQVEYVQKITIITLTVPTLGMKNVVDFKYDVIPYLKANPKIIIDLSRLQFIDSSGCGIIFLPKNCQRIGWETSYQTLRCVKAGCIDFSIDPIQSTV